MIQGVYPGVTTIELDELAAQTSAYMATQHPDFSKLAARISVSNLHKQTEKVRAAFLFVATVIFPFCIGTPVMVMEMDQGLRGWRTQS